MKLVVIALAVLHSLHLVSAASSLPEPISGVRRSGNTKGKRGTKPERQIGDWGEAFQQAKAFVDQLTLEEKVNVCGGTRPSFT